MCNAMTHSMHMQQTLTSAAVGLQGSNFNPHPGTGKTCCSAMSQRTEGRTEAPLLHLNKQCTKRAPIAALVIRLTASPRAAPGISTLEPSAHTSVRSIFLYSSCVRASRVSLLASSTTLAHCRPLPLAGHPLNMAPSRGTSLLETISCLHCMDQDTEMHGICMLRAAECHIVTLHLGLLLSSSIELPSKHGHSMLGGA